MRTQIRKLSLAVAAVFGVTALAMIGGPLVDRDTDFRLVASAHAKDEGGTSGGHTSGGSGGKGGGESGSKGAGESGGHTSGGSSGHTSGGSSGHTSGGSSGGHTSGGDSGGSSGHSSGGKGSPHTTSARHGMEQSAHGTKVGHEGHSSGVHGANATHGGKVSAYHASGAARTFGGGSGLSTTESVMEGPARFAPNSTLSLTETLQPGPKFTFRYWGGWTVPTDGGGDDGVVVAQVIVDPTPVGGGGGQLARLDLASAARCDGVGGNMPTRSFYTNANLGRLDAARKEIDPGYVAGRGESDPAMMAAVQEALVDGRSDPVLVGTYLGMMSRTTVTPETVNRVAYRLCVPVNDAAANNIAEAAQQVNFTASAD
jgi:hypothetical protein